MKAVSDLRREKLMTSSRSDSPIPLPLVFNHAPAAPGSATAAALPSSRAASGNSNSARRRSSSQPVPVQHCLIGTRYKILKEIGRGAQGIAFLAEDRNTHPPSLVAIKQLCLRAQDSPCDELDVDDRGRPLVLSAPSPPPPPAAIANSSPRHRDATPPLDATLLHVAELQALSLLSHPAILVFKHAWWESSNGGHLMIATEYCAGGSLASFCKRLFWNGKKRREQEQEQEQQHQQGRRYVPEAWLWSWLHQTLSGLQYAREQGWLHRDLKLENLFVVDAPSAHFSSRRHGSHHHHHHDRDDVHDEFADVSAPTLRIGDWGLSKLLSSGHAESFCGSVAFVSPELIAGRYSFATDVWSLGAIFYFLLSRQLPFSAGKSDLSMLRSISSDEVAAFPPGVCEIYSSPLRQIVLSMLTKDPDKRPTSAVLLHQAEQQQQQQLLLHSTRRRCTVLSSMRLLKFVVKRSTASSITLSVNIREAPSQESAVVRKLEAGDMIDIVGVVAVTEEKKESQVGSCDHWYELADGAGFCISTLNGTPLFADVVR